MSANSNTDKSVNEHGLYEVRLGKIKEMQKAGIEAWAEYKPISAFSKQVIEEFEDGTEKEYVLAGRLISIREHGKTVFANIFDQSGQIQLYIKKDILGDESFEIFEKYLDLGDIIWIKGIPFKTRVGEITIKVSKLSLLSKCLHPLPEKYHGLTDIEQRYRQRYLDLISNSQSADKFKKRSKIIQSIRDFLLDKEFLEVETPMLHPIPGGAAAKPFVTHHNAYDMELFLRIAPELYLKRLVIGGFDRVFEINRNFRNEGVSTKHNPEFTMLEFYMAHGDYKTGMDLTEELIANAIKENTQVLPTQVLPTQVFQGKEIDFSRPFKRLTVMESLIEVAGFTSKDLDKDNLDKIIKDNNIKVAKKKLTYGEKLWILFEELVEDKLVSPVFITGHPIEVSPLAKRDPQDPFVASRFELFICGMELANGFTELNDPFDQADRFKQQADAAKLGYDEAHRFDADYIKALEYGLPPAVGVGIGIDRLAMILTDTASIKDIILFPTMKFKEQ